jgi:hypothetical protein
VKVYTQNKGAVYDFGNVWVSEYYCEFVIFNRLANTEKSCILGQYSTEERARGVLYEMLDAYKRKERIFYMPTT